MTDKYLYIHSQIYDNLCPSELEALCAGVGRLVMGAAKASLEKLPDKPIVRISISFEPLDKYDV